MNFKDAVSHSMTLLLGSALMLPAVLCAQPSCDDLVIEHVWYAAFDSTGVEVLVTNNESVGFSAPQFNLVHTNLDTLAREPFDFFAMPGGKHTYTMRQMPGMPSPPTPFTGELVLLYQDTDGIGTCMFPLSGIELCPPPPCTELYLGVHQTGSLVIATIGWSVIDNDGYAVASGAIALDTIGPWQRIDTLCLPPGNYELHVEPAVLSPFGQFYCKLFRDPQVYPDPHVLIAGDESGQFPFSYYAPCAEDASAVEVPTFHALQWSITGALLHLTNTAVNALGTVDLFDAHGSSIAQRKVNTSMATFDLTGQAPGLYIIRAIDGTTTRTERFILH